jgi:hypothetical protein
VIQIDVEWVQTWVVAFLLKYHTLFSDRLKKYKRNPDYTFKKLLNSLNAYYLDWLSIFATFTTLCAFLATWGTDAQGNSLGRTFVLSPEKKFSGDGICRQVDRACACLSMFLGQNSSAPNNTPETN